MGGSGREGLVAVSFCIIISLSPMRGKVNTCAGSICFADSIRLCLLHYDILVMQSFAWTCNVKFCLKCPSYDNETCV